MPHGSTCLRVLRDCKKQKYDIDSSDSERPRITLSVDGDRKDTVVCNRKETHRFQFDSIFDTITGQDQIFNGVGKPVVDKVIQGYNGTIFAYGQTSSGKTFTVTGGAEKYIDRGLIPRVIEYIFKHFEKNVDTEFTMRVSYLEIYNETGYDLLDARHNSAKKLEELPRVTLFEDTEAGTVHLKNLSIHPAVSVDEALNLLFMGDTNRVIAEVIVALSEKQRSHVPYRNSMMTMMLRDSLGGNCMTSMIANCSIEKRNWQETISTCRFAQRVAMIKNELTVNEEHDPRLVINRLRQEVDRLKAELSLATGVECEEELTMEEKERCEKIVAQFLAGEGTIHDGGFPSHVFSDIRKIYYCFSIVQKIHRGALKKREDSNALTQPQPVAPPLPMTTKEATELRDVVAQRDHEIRILVELLKKEKVMRKSGDPVQHTSNGSQLHDQTSNDKCEKEGHEDNNNDGTVDHVSAWLEKEAQSRLLGDLSTGRAEAFELFKRDYRQRGQIDAQKEELRSRYVEAKELGRQMYTSREEAGILQTQIAAMLQVNLSEGTNGSSNSVSDAQPIREQLNAKREEYRLVYAALRELKPKIEHLQHTLETAKIQLMRDFDTWWTRQCEKHGNNSKAGGFYMSNGAENSHVSLMTMRRAD